MRVSSHRSVDDFRELFFKNLALYLASVSQLS